MNRIKQVNLVNFRIIYTCFKESPSKLISNLRAHSDNVSQVAIQSTQQLLWEVLFSSGHVTSDHVTYSGHVTGEDDDDSEFTEVNPLVVLCLVLVFILANKLFPCVSRMSN